MTCKWLYTSWINDRPYYKHIKVNNEEEKNIFIHELESIKHRMAVINNLVNAGILSNVELRNNIDVWLKICNEFQEKWGARRVPADVRIAINNTRAEFHYSQLHFGVDEGALVNKYRCPRHQHLHT